MKATELMVGNLVMLGDKIIRIDAIHKRKVGYHVRFDKLNFVFVDRVSGIPLTPEILEKNGFVEEEDGLFLLKSKDWVVGLDYFEKKQWTIGIANFPNKLDELVINYVHELQNALTLCEIENEIEL